MSEEAKLRSGLVALVGRPNVGKSTLMNHLIGQKIAITSRKPQTTRGRIRTVYNDERGQIVFLDTPGLHRAKNKLGAYMVRAAENTLKEADAVVWLVEPEEKAGPGDLRVAKILERTALPTILVVNKIDKVKKDVVQRALDAHSGLCRFEDVLAVSAIHGTGLDSLTDSIFRVLPYGPRYFDEETVTDQPVRQIAAELIREKALRSLGEEVPHGIAVVIDRMQEREGRSLTDIEATIVCEKDSHKGIIIGKKGAMLKKIGSEARADIEDLLQTQVDLKLWVKVRKNWRESDTLLRNYGYSDE